MTEIAHGEIKIDLNDEKALQGLRAIEAKFDATMAKIDRAHADATIGADATKFENTINQAERKLSAIDRKKAIAELELKTAAFDDEVTRAKDKLKKLQGEKAEVELKVRPGDLEKINKQIKIAEREVKSFDGMRAEARLELNLNKASFKAAEARLKAIQDKTTALENLNHRILAQREKEEKAAASAQIERAKKVAATTAALQKQKYDEFAKAESDARRMEKSNEAARRKSLNDAESVAHRMEAIRNKELSDIPKMRLQYAQLSKAIDDLNAKRGKSHGDSKAKMIVDLDIKNAAGKMEEIKAKLNRLGADPPVGIEAELRPGSDFGRRMRHTVEEGFKRGGVLTAARHGGVLASREFSRGLVDNIQHNLSPATLGKGLLALGTKLGRGFEGISQATVRLGPFTSSIRGVIGALSLLGPLLIDVAGAAGAFIGVLGSGTVGLLGSVTAGAGAFGLVLGSTALLLPSLLRDFKNLNTLQAAYHKQVLKTGAGSDKAKAKLQALNHAVKQVGPGAREAYQGFNKLQDSWRNLAKQARPSFFKGLGESFKTGQGLIKSLGPEIIQSFKLVSKGWQNMMKALRGPEAGRIFKTLFDSGQKALPAFGRGLGNIAHAIGNIAAAFSKMLPSLGKGFEGWTKGILGFTQNAAKMNALVNKTTQSMRDIGHFAASGGKLLTAFFGGGVTAGQGFLRSMTQTMDKWTAFLRTAKGKKDLANFFQQSVHGAQALFGAITPLISSFVRWAILIAPIARIFAQMAGAVTGLASSLLSATVLRGPLTALVATLGALWGVSKISGAVRQISGFVAGLLGVSRAQTAVAATAARATEAELALAAATARVAEAQGASAIAGARAAEGRGASLAAGALAARGPLGIGTSGAGRALTAAEKEAQAAARAAGGVGKIARAGGMATTALRGLGLATLGVSSGFAGLAIVGGIAAFGLYKLLTKTKDWTKSSQESAKATEQLRGGLTNLQDLSIQSTQSTIDMTSAEQGLHDTRKQSNSEERQLSKMRKQGKQDTAAYTGLLNEHKNTLLQVNQAQLNVTATHRQQAAAALAVRQQAGATAEAADKAAHKASDAQRQLGGAEGGAIDGKNVTVAQAYDKISAAAKKAGVSIKEWIKDEKPFIDPKRLDEYGKAINTTTARLKAQANASNQLYLSTLNQARASKGLAPIAERNAAAFAKVARLGSQKIATRISLKYDDPARAGRVAQSASRALQQGARPATVRLIVAGAKSAEEAVQRLNRLTLKTKVQQITQRGGEGALAMFSKIAGRRLTTKEQRIIEQGGPNVLAKLGQIKGQRLATKIQQILENGGAKVLGILSSIAASASNRTQTITTLYRSIGKPTTGANDLQGGGRPGRGPRAASGRRPGIAPINALVGEGGGPEWLVNARKGIAEKTRGPEFVALGRDDAVIPTEPKHRNRGRHIFKRIADDLGLDKFASGVYHGKLDKGGYYSPSSNLGDPPSIPKTPKNIRRGSSGFGKRKKKAYASGRDYIAYIAGLKGAQDDWEHEVSIRQSQIQEPESLLIEDGRIIVKDPETQKDVDVGPKMVPNEAGIAGYKASLAYVQQAFTELLTVITTLIAAIPQALQAIDLEDMYRRANIHNLQGTIHHEQGIIKAHSGAKQSKNDKEIVARHQKNLDAAEKNLEHERGQREVIKQDRGTLIEDQKAAGFSFREVSLESDKNQQEYNAVSDRAVTQATEANASAADPGKAGTFGGGGGGGAASDQLSYDQQSAIADTQRAEVLKQFGGNMAAIGSALGTVGTSPAGSGPGAVNAALRDPSAAGGPVVDLRATGGRAGTAFSAPAQSAPVAGATSTKNVSIVNNFQQPPPDPHTFIQRMRFESAGAF